MLWKQLALAAALGLTGFAALARADDKPAKPIAQDEQAFALYRAIFVETMTEPLARIRQTLHEMPIETRGLDKDMSLAEFLTAVAAKTAGDRKVTIRLDDKALGKELARIADVKVKWRRTGEDEKTTLHGLVRFALDQAAKEVGSELDYTIRAEGVVITWPRLAAYRAEYNLAKILGPMPQVASDLKHLSVDQNSDVKADNLEGVLTHVLTTSIRLRPWESVELVNGTRLVVNASADRHSEFVDFLDQLRRLSDLALIMNARLIEVDNAFFDRHVAPFYAKSADGVEPPEVVLVPEALFKMLSSQKQLVASDDAKLPRGRESVFLSRHIPFRLDSAVPQTDDFSINSAVEGISFAVDAQFTPDRRFIRLRTTRRVDQLMGTKKRVVDTPRGRFEIETPDVHQSSVSGTVQIPEQAAILMRCGFRPVGDTSKDKVWLMLARPYIWIDAEMIERGVKSVSAFSKDVWTGEFPKHDETTAATEVLPVTDAVKEILQAVLTDVLKNPKLQGVRDFYGTAGSTKLVLDDGGRFSWPWATCMATYASHSEPRGLSAWF